MEFADLVVLGRILQSSEWKVPEVIGQIKRQELTSFHTLHESTI